MEHCLNLNVSSVIVAFDDNSAFEYTYASADKSNIERAKSFAQQDMDLISISIRR
ncbi:hypothetical protein JMN32_07250 [Fulvivirga sp. 29W222]|uniref:Uncharacterized protein n=1 Tax=Fulvivirga marina TaxID=2494733 RepID=A0A937FWR6_9BACT|nr:hypothetical protein [Fulvivirga marina]MBL6446097.1 hypothetical protein [Fulvivirga marina]